MAVIEGERANSRREKLLGDTPGAFAQARFVRVPPMKARRVINLIRGLTTAEAMTTLRFAPQAASVPIAKVLASAIANAEHNERLDPELLFVSSAYVDEGPTLKRIQPRAQGRAYRIRKRSCHITVVVESVEAAGSTKSGRRAAGKPAQDRKAKSTASAPAKAKAAEPAKASKPAAKKAPASKSEAKPATSKKSTDTPAVSQEGGDS